MAKFNPDIPQSNDPSYLGYSRESSGDRSMATLFSGLSGVVEGGVKAYDEAQQTAIRQDVTGGVAEVNQSLLGVMGTTEDAENQDDELGQDKESADEFGGETNAATLNATPDAPAALGDARRLTQAVRAGKITPEHYWARMEVLSKKLKSRYPGYSEIIDRQFQGITGSIPANAYAAAQRKTYAGTLSDEQKDEKKFQTFVQQNIQFLQPDYYDRISAGKPYSRLEVYERVRQLKSRDYQSQYERNVLARSKETSEFDKDKAVSSAMFEVDRYVNQTLSDGTGAFQNLTETLRKAQENPQALNPKDKVALTTAFSQLRFQVQQGIDSLMSRTADDGKSNYLSIIGDPSKIKGIKEQALTRIDEYKRLLDDGDYGLLNSTLNYNKAIQQDATRRLFESSNYWKMVNAAKELGGTEILNQLFLQSDWEKMKDDAARAFRDMAILGTVTGDTNPVSTDLANAKKTAEALRWDSQDQKRLYRGMIDNNVKILMSDDSPMQSWQAASTKLFGQENRSFLSTLMTSQRHDIYTKLTSPEMTERMKQLGKTDPSTYANYRAWAKGGFLQLFQQLGTSVQEGVVNREGILIDYDPSASQFVVSPSERGLHRQSELQEGNEGLVSGYLKSFEDAFQKDAEAAVQQLNQRIQALKPILVDEGKDVNEELAGLLQHMGIRTDAPKAKTLFQEMRSKIIRSLGAETPGAADKKGDPAEVKARRESAAKSFTQYARAGRMDSETFLSRIRADGDEDVGNLSPDLRDTLATMLQDAPPEVASQIKVDSGYRSIQKQRQLWAAALRKYGGVRKARQWVAPPGHSYHNRGLAVDLSYGSPEAREWVQKNARQYGLHFPLRNEDWHIELAGSRTTKRKGA